MFGWRKKTNTHKVSNISNKLPNTRKSSSIPNSHKSSVISNSYKSSLTGHTTPITMPVAHRKKSIQKNHNKSTMVCTFLYQLSSYSYIAL
ncbi:unnamed protein product [Bursaphelenchus okinawaensis]|uniref:Uncharacterized protein n=1 Tax=Bursaphelenchus okinawaensis TaxID=465554 RepID=A0A811LPR8_9BILA|nr:unnamed protein product [Bursaphelenchus okinawaensis]CAG9127251.1 unnamed protein product [Bursaphelenchus okinawaensis]